MRCTLGLPYSSGSITFGEKRGCCKCPSDCGSTIVVPCSREGARVEWQSCSRSGVLTITNQCCCCCCCCPCSMTVPLPLSSSSSLLIDVFFFERYLRTQPLTTARILGRWSIARQATYRYVRNVRHCPVPPYASRMSSSAHSALHPPSSVPPTAI